MTKNKPGIYFIVVILLCLIGVFWGKNSFPGNSWEQEKEENLDKKNTAKIEVLGYYAFDSLQALQTNADTIREMAAAWYTIDAQGRINGQTNAQVLAQAKKDHISTFALIQNLTQGNFSSAVAHQFLSKANRKEAIKEIAHLAKKNGFDGINLDIELVEPEDRNNFSLFVKELAKELHGNSLSLALSLPAKTGDPKKGWHYAYDYQALAQWADKIVIMAYDQHWFGGDPGPVASAGWVKQVTEYAVRKIPEEKIFIGLGYYGYDWGTKGSYVSGREIFSLIATYKVFPFWDEESNCPTFKYYDSQSKLHEVWFENPQSIQEKLEVIDQYPVAGIALWEISFLDRSAWEVIKEYSQKI
ncbi:glycosyl hydrolase family 18 protein [Candidatus Formimonas warabiya]|uniref:GH18 domain-containing protein n=1 Tax=Formimonas warabiya TaxID=1761012 RepID=A0A3G1KP88_FORW1|nr:glycosyl hydrolase family 18 protein [Candidatus Formimonas warabiya]ATW24240.1 hypothetical protein DCMF_05070 [Candidatus Formimonas warabiya]